MKSAGSLGTTKKKKIIAIAATMTSIRIIDLTFNILEYRKCDYKNMFVNL